MSLDVLAAVIFFAVLLAFCIWGIKHEVQHMKALTAKEKKHYELYEAILAKLNEV